MNFDKWVHYNWLDLSHNYNARYNYIYKTSFDEFCRYIYKGLEIGAWLPIEYKRNITKEINK